VADIKKEISWDMLPKGNPESPPTQCRISLIRPVSSSSTVLAN